MLYFSALRNRLNSFPLFFDNPFNYLDVLSVKIGRFEFNMFRDDVKLRKSVLYFVHISVMFWLIGGWDSCASQLQLFIQNLPFYLIGRITWDELVFSYLNDYGKGGMHWSAFVIYGLCFYFLSKYYREKLGLVNSRNLVLAFCFSFLGIGLFEHFWHWSYYFFQNQPWIISWSWPQLRVLVQTTLFTFLGLYMIFMVRLKHRGLYGLPFTNKLWMPLTYLPKFKFNLDRVFFVSLGLTLASIFLWWFYPWSIQFFSVPVVGGGVWFNSKYFPQTVYTVETNILDNISAGDQFFMKNDLLHGVNLLCKILFTITIYYLGRIEYDSS